MKTEALVLRGYLSQYGPSNQYSLWPTWPYRHLQRFMQMPSLTIPQKAFLIVSLPLAFQIVFACTLFSMLNQAEVERQQEASVREYGQHLNSILKLLLERGTSTVIAHVSRSDVFWQRTRTLQQRLYVEEREITALSQNSPARMQFLSQFLTLLAKCQTQLDISKRYAANHESAKAAIALVQMGTAIDRLSSLVETVSSQQTVLEIEKKESQARLRKQTAQIIYLGVFANFAMAAFLVWYFNQTITRQFRKVTDNALRFAAGKTLTPRMRGYDELAVLDRTIISMAQSIDELRANERRLLDKTLDVICSITEKGVFVNINPACQTQWGASQDALIGARIDRVLHPDDLLLFREAMAQACQIEREVMVKCRVLTVLDGPRFVSWSLQWSEEDKLMFCIVHDISEKVAMEQLKDDFTAMVGHDLKVPINSLGLMHDMLLKGVYGELTEKARQRLVEAKQTTKKLLHLIDELLDLHKLETAELILEREPVEIHSLFAETDAQVRELAREKHIEVIYQLSESQPAINVDGMRVLQVLVNLVSNAIKFAPELSRVEVEFKKIENAVCFSVRDSGPGVPVTLRPVVFDKFSTFSTAANRNREGRGLGLAICKLIVEKHNGTLELHCPAEGGSVFSFIIPTS